MLSIDRINLSNPILFILKDDCTNLIVLGEKLLSQSFDKTLQTEHIHLEQQMGRIGE